MQQMAQQLRSVNEDHQTLMELFEVLRSGRDDIAAAVLVRIRIGEPAAVILRELRAMQMVPPIQ